MTSLNYTLSRTLGRDLQPGDGIVVTRLDHDANVAPWLDLAKDRGLEVRLADVHADTTLDLSGLERLLGPRTRVVAFPWASNAVGTIVDARAVCDLAHQAGALAWVDAVQYAPHERIAWGEALRIGLAHYNTLDEMDRFSQALATAVAAHRPVAAHSPGRTA